MSEATIRRPTITDAFRLARFHNVIADGNDCAACGEQFEVDQWAIDVPWDDPSSRLVTVIHLSCGIANGEVEVGTDDLLAHYSDALTEIYELRAALAYEAQVLKAHLDYKSFPKSRRKYAEEQIERMKQAAAGKAKVAYAGTSFLKQSLRWAGASETLTRWQWEHRHDDR